MKIWNRFLIYVVAEALVVPAVIMIFKLTPDRQMAAVQAGILFLLIPLLILMREVLKFKSRHWVFMFGHLQFLLLFAIPIFSLRLSNWGVPFNDLSLLGIPGVQLHQFSNYGYTLMFATSLWTYRKIQHIKKPS